MQLLTKRLKSLEINGVYGVRKEDLETLRGLIIDPNTKQSRRNKIFYHEHSRSSRMEENETDDPRIDVDVCPICNEVRMVFDCPRLHEERCRGCSSCIERCIECGECMKDDQETEDSLCGDALCLECWLKLPKCNFCNKPYCSLHAYRKHALPENGGFICDYCHSRSLIENAEDQIMNH